ncbi:hypothetical protein Ppa06_58320 [Planomonospora parontospora subsp. parontospora]|uniref:Uncharacterized protein n=2 Tax=Planomonospora parontospora TaxID=58119 RepID=A0AA37BM62_9ACTN|nr:hypothetical protein [Planomonospora parontospora]GGK90116.1 hypothetical protein GCM10010126_56990 [Planomonospora parontospora]GII12034.1 hypothetical protein Ppa06_58320 [Planomonospora parontospora subsp. parontospora]
MVEHAEPFPGPEDWLLKSVRSFLENYLSSQVEAQARIDRNLEESRQRLQERIDQALDRPRSLVQARIEQALEAQRQRMSELAWQAVERHQERTKKAAEAAVGHLFARHESALQRAAQQLFAVDRAALIRMIKALQDNAERPAEQPPVVGEMASSLPPLQMSASGTVTATGSIEITTIDVWPGEWDREKTKKFVQFYFAFLALVLLGSLAHRLPDEFDVATAVVGGGVLPGAQAMWIYVGKAFDKLYPPDNES